METSFPAISHHDLLMFLIQFAALLLAARLLGELAQRLGQPAVIGEILAGIILGPSLLGALPLVGEWLIPQTAFQAHLLDIIALLGAMFLLLITGLETDLGLIQRHARTAVGASLGGISLNLAAGFALARFLPASLMGDPEQRLVFVSFVAISLAISAIPVIAKVLIDLNLTRRDVSQTIIAAAMIDDTIGWIMLSVVIGMAEGAVISLGSIVQSIGSVLLVMAVSMTFGRVLVKWLLSFTRQEIASPYRRLTLIVVLMLLWGAVTHALHLEAFLGAFILGIVLSQIRVLDSGLIHRLESFAFGILAPVFFAVAGLKMNLLGILRPPLLYIAIGMVAVAILCKLAGVYLGARLIGRRDHWTAIFLGSGLNARGSMGIIVGSIGLSLGIFSQDMFSIIMLMAVTTSLMAPPALRWALSHIKAEDQELERLRQEELTRHSMMTNVRRVLLPVRVRNLDDDTPIQTLEARLLAQIGRKANLSVTLLNVANNITATDSNEFLNHLKEHFSDVEVMTRVVADKKPGDAILDEAKKHYDLLVLGASERKGDASTVLFTPLVDHLMRLAPVPTILVHGERVNPDWNPRRILVPTNGSVAARRAAEVAFFIATDPEDEVIILQVVERNEEAQVLDASGALLERQLRVAEEIVAELRDLGRSLRVQTIGEVRQGIEPESVILDAAREERIDLIALGTDVRAGSDRLYLGPRVERILNNAACPVIVVNS